MQLGGLSIIYDYDLMSMRISKLEFKYVYLNRCNDHDYWTIPTANMMYTRSQNYTMMVVGKHGIHTFKVMVVVLLLLLLLLDVFVPISAHPLLYLDK